MIAQASAKVEISRDRSFIDAIQRNLENSRYHRYLERVLEILEDRVVYLWGGAVRDPIVREMYDQKVETRDFDFTVDDSEKRIDLNRLLVGLEGLTSSRFGTPKWKPAKGLEIDIWPFSAGTIFRIKNLPVNLENVLRSVDVTTSALAYGIDDKTIYSVEALNDIERKEVNVLNQYGEDPSALMCRLVLQSHRLKFEVGKKGRVYVAKRYSPDLDLGIKRYLNYKGAKPLFNFVVRRLRQIQGGT
jgi:tRNA nucleotidyltransferase/poly(A) polymerase